MELLGAADTGERSVPALVQALADSNAVVRRTAVRLLARLGETGAAGLAAAQEDEDLLVRRTALIGLTRLGPERALTAAGRALEDASPAVRLAAVHYLATLRPRPPAALALLQGAREDEDERIRIAANRATWPFHRDGTSLRDRQYDHDLVVAAEIPLPKEGWRFRLDPRRRGHLEGWYGVELEEAGWDTIRIEQAWQKGGYDYVGVAWYRRTFELPAEPAHEAADIRFAGVDESAWVWLNGEYVGEHDIGASGWNQPFRLDITSLVRWGAPNQITVRAMNTAHAGGIWRPAAVEVLR